MELKDAAETRNQGSAKHGAHPSDRPRRARKKTGLTIPEQLEAVVSALERALAKGDLSGFYRELRSTDLPRVAAIQKDLPGLPRLCSDIVHRLGGISPAVALAFENHLYVTAALATFPETEDRRLETRRRALLHSLAREGHLIANTNLIIHSDKIGAVGMTVRREGAELRANGVASYLSLATQAELLVFFALVEGQGFALFTIPLKGNPSIEIGPFLFPRAMLDSDTRKVTFHDTRLTGRNMLLGGRDDLLTTVMEFQITWHQMLIAALYLGAGARAIEEARSFLRSVHIRDDRPLAELDGMIVEVGRMAIRYRTACALVHETEQILEELISGKRPLSAVPEALDFASAAKDFGTKCAEELVGDARRIIGARAFSGDNPIERLTQEVIFGLLGPEVSASVERRHGKRALGEKPFWGLRW